MSRGAIAIAIAVVVGSGIYAFSHRYSLSVMAGGKAVEVDRWTGRVWSVEGDRKTLLTEPAESQLWRLGQEELALVEVIAYCEPDGASRWRVVGQIHNQSEWVIWDLEVTFGASRHRIDYFSSGSTIPPLAVRSFSIPVLAPPDPLEWSIEGGTGFLPQEPYDAFYGRLAGELPWPESWDEGG